MKSLVYLRIFGTISQESVDVCVLLFNFRTHLRHTHFEEKIKETMYAAFVRSSYR